MGEVRWRILLLALAATALFIALANSSTATLCSQCGQYDIECQTTCTPDPYCGDGTCNNGETCGTCPYDCGTAVCSSGQTQLTSLSCGANETWTQICTSNLCGWTNYQCTCIEGSTVKCDATTYKTCTNGAWGNCQYDCRNVVCNSPPVCKTGAGTCGANGCTYPNNAPYGEPCTDGKRCDGQGSCTLNPCTGLCLSTPNGNTSSTPTQNAYCPSGKYCYACAATYTRTPDHPDGACLKSTCSPSDAAYCEGSNLKTCTLQSSGLYAWTTTTCSVCTVSPPPAKCCTPESQTATCGTSNCGTKLNNCGQSVTCGACPENQYCSSTTPGIPGTCTTTCTPTAEICDGQDNDCDSQVDEGGSALCADQTCKTKSCAGTSGCTYAPQSGTTCTIHSQAGTCQSGTCVPNCVPECQVPSDVACNQPLSNGCGGTCAGTGTYCNNADALCTTAGCQVFGISLRYDGTATPIPEPLTVAAGTSTNIKPVLSGTISTYAYTITWLGSVYERSRESYFALAPTTANLGTHIITFTAKSGSQILTSKSITVNVQCTTNDACYCTISSTAGCLTSTANSVAATGYCAAGSCRTCAYNNVSTGTACVQCTTVSHCAVTDAECQVPRCTSNICNPEFKPAGTKCNNNVGVCENGFCNGCDQTECKKKDTSAIEAGTPYIDGCSKLTPQTLVMTNHTCGGNSCVPRATLVELSPIRENADDGTSCGTGNACQSGKCVNKACLNGTICDTLDWTANLRSCNGIMIATCGTDITCTKPVVGSACVNASVQGFCTGQDQCVAQCPADQLPGCKPSANANYVDTSLTCENSQKCYTCAPGHVYKTSDGTCVVSAYRFDFTAQATVMREDIFIKPVITDVNGKDRLDDFKFQLATTGLGQSVNSVGAFSIRIDEPGVYPATLTAFRKGTGAAEASVTKSLTVTCPTGNACCPYGETAFKSEGSTCVVDNIPGTCRNRQCDLSCVPKAHVETGTDEQGKNRCNNGLDDDCNGLTDCYEPSCQSFCGNIRCPPGAIICSDACTNLNEDNLNCGACGKRCKPDERCTESACIQVKGCDIVCNNDRDCGKGRVCINAGDCTKSYCEQSNVVRQNDTDIRGLGEIIARTRTHMITKELRGDELRITVKNLAAAPLRNFNLTVNIPKEMAEDASDLGANTPFFVIVDDPVIDFRFEQIGAKQLIQIDLPHTVDASLLESVYISGAHDPVSGDIQALTQDDITITSNLVTEQGRSRILVGLDPHSRLYGVRIPVHIPKCVAESVKDLKISGSYEVILDDPLVVWTFDSLTSKEVMEIEVGKEVDESCTDQLTAFAVADLADDPVNPWLPLLIIPVLGVIIVFFQRFHAGAEEHMGRKEFEALGKEQGQTKEQIDESWKEYERKW